MGSWAMRGEGVGAHLSRSWRKRTKPSTALPGARGWLPKTAPTSSSTISAANMPESSWQSSHRFARRTLGPKAGCCVDIVCIADVWRTPALVFARIDRASSSSPAITHSRSSFSW